MKKPPLDPQQFGILRMFDQYARERGLKLSDTGGQAKFVEDLTTLLQKHRGNDTLIHGFRIQTMFAYFAAALGGCKIISEEDAGDFFTAAEDVKRPDFRVLTHKGEEFFVEVKNFNPGNPRDPYILDSAYAQKLRNYSRSFGKPLLLAIYWRPWHLWTLTNLDDFTAGGANYILALTETIRNDQKALLGDRLIGISKPLAMRFYTDPAKPRKLEANGNCHFTIGKVTFMAGGREIVDPFEMRLAWFFLLYGRWEDVEQPACIENGELIWFDFRGVMNDSNPDQDFLLVGNLSEMISEQFNSMTVEDGKIASLSPKTTPDKLGVLIPSEFKGDVLQIWQFRMRPARPVFPTAKECGINEQTATAMA
jgi:hypothetical protein